jgi:hypothetical protein
MLVGGCPPDLPQKYVFITVQYWRSVFGHSLCDWDQIQNLYYKCLHTIRIEPRNEEASNNHNGFKFLYKVAFLYFLCIFLEYCSSFSLEVYCFMEDLSVVVQQRIPPGSRPRIEPGTYLDLTASRRNITIKLRRATSSFIKPSDFFNCLLEAVFFACRHSNSVLEWVFR